MSKVAATTRVMMAYPAQMGGSRYHRLHVPAMALRMAGMTVTVVPDLLDVSVDEMAKHDVVIVNNTLTDKAVLAHRNKRGTIDLLEHPQAKMWQVLENIRKADVRVIVDMDDTWNFPSIHPGYAHYMLCQQREATILGITEADAVWCSTLPLLHDVQKLNTAAIHIPNGISHLDTQWHDLKKQETVNMLRIGVGAMYTSEMNLPRLREAIHAMRKMQHWVLVAMGVNDERRAKVARALHCDRIIFLPVADATAYAQYYAHIDLLLCPLTHNVFNMYRSDIKVAECAYSDTAVLCEDHGPYHKSHFATKNWHTDLPALVKQWATDRTVLKPHTPMRLGYGTAMADAERVKCIEQLVK